MRWLIDFDSTLSNTHVEAIQAVNRRFGTSFTEEDFNDWNTDLILTPEQAKYMWGEEVFFNEDFQRNTQPVPNAIEGLRELVEHGHTAVVVTDRAPSLQNVTREWLDSHGLSDIPVAFTRSKQSRTSHLTARTKAQVAWSRRLDTVVEDAPHHSLSLAQRSYIDKVWLLDKPYNRGIEHPKIERIESWKDIP